MLHNRPGKYLSTPIQSPQPLINYINKSPLPSIYPPPLPSSAEEILHYNNLIGQNRQLYEDNKILLIKLEKYEKLQPYINTLIAKNVELQSQIQQLNTENLYLTKNTRELHVQNKNTQSAYQNKLKELNDLIQAGKDNGNRVRAENQNLNNKIRLHLSEIEQYKRKLEEALTDKVHQEEHNKEVKSQRDRLIGQIKQLENYNKEIAKNSSIKQDQLVEKIQNKDMIIKMLERDKEELIHNLEKSKEEIKNLEAELKETGLNLANLSANHESMLNDYRANSLKRAEVEQLYEESLEKIARREEQLREIQMFRDEEKEIYHQQFMKMQMIFEDEKSEYQQAIQHKSLKNEKLTEAFNQLMQRFEYAQKQIWEAGAELEAKEKQLMERDYRLQEIQSEMRTLLSQIKASQQREQTILSKAQFIEEKNNSMQQTLFLIEKKYQSREDEFEAYVKNMRAKFESEKIKWDELFEDEKNKLKMTHEYEKKQVQTLLNKKILMLEGEIEDYRARLSRAERDKIEKAEKDIILGKAIIHENRITNLIQKSFDRRSVQKKPISEFNQASGQASGSKTARYPGIK